MSLLIKALDKAQNAKNEQVEKSKKKQADENNAGLEIEAEVSNKSHTEISQNKITISGFQIPSNPIKAKPRSCIQAGRGLVLYGG